ncbi:protein Mis18-beta [Rana temporaria]|uniref:protein Mis18-beta n=1 Tax=Rana temporaria TaxID=8407 RepID=UPI001AACD39C|nr:protein Mis18-beta [Rana temporaria]
MATYTVCGNEMYSLYQCKSCHSVLSEGMSLCGHNENLTVIAFLRVTSDVNMSDALEFGIDDDLEGCAFNHLTCKGCDTLIGFNLYSATRPYTHLRGLFCLLKQHLLCYLIESKTTIEGTQLQFDFTQFINGIRELKESLAKMYSRVATLTCKSKKLEQR